MKITRQSKAKKSLFLDSQLDNAFQMLYSIQSRVLHLSKDKFTSEINRIKDRDNFNYFDELDLLEEMYQLPIVRDRDNTPILTATEGVKLAMIHLARAIYWFYTPNNTHAWPYLSRAMCWIGLLLNNDIDSKKASSKLELLSEVFAETKCYLAHSEASSQNAAKKHELAYGKTIEKCYELVRTHVPETKWKTRSAAIKSLEQEILRFSESQPKRLSKYNLEKTVTKWLREMPDYDKYFQK